MKKSAVQFQSYLKNLGFECDLENYVNSKTDLKIFCNLGHSFTASPDLLKLRKRKCLICTKPNNLKKTLEDVEIFAKSIRYSVLSNRYVNSSTVMNFCCPIGHLVKVTFRDLVHSGVRCGECQDKISWDEEKIRTWLKKEGFHVLPFGYNGVKTKLTVICENGHIRKSSWFNLLYQVKGCPVCIRNKKSIDRYNKNQRMHGTDATLNIKWRNQIFCRDSFTCQSCGNKKGGNLNAHHIFNWHSHKDLRFDLDNGITLCENCHKLFHFSYGNRDNNRDQLAIFLNKFRE